jgi:hypothetical protein
MDDDTSEKFRQWATLKAQTETMSSRMNKLRDSLMETVMAEGSQDEKGNQHFDLPAPIEVAGKTFKGIKREARVSTVLNEERAFELIDAKGLASEVVKFVPQVDMDALYAAYQRGKLTSDEIDGLMDTKKTFAFKAVAE